MVGTQGNDSMNGAGGNDKLKGAGGNDTIAGGLGSDTIAGGIGNDALAGGAGSDTFVFDTPLDASTNVDTVNGFAANNADKIALDPTVFAALFGGATSGVDANEFAANAGGNALDANDYLLYDTATGSLYYDADGNGATAKVLFATLTGLTGTLDNTDFTTIPPPGP